MKIIRPSSDVFRAECWCCNAILEYELYEVGGGYIKCPCCGEMISHRNYGKPIEKSEDMEGER